MFSDDLQFLQQHVAPVVLRCGPAAVVVVPAYQGRVMTSSFDAGSGPSCGWINRPVIAAGVLPEAERAGKLEQHIHVFGGEERLWIGPEGGQFSIYFPVGADFEFEHWQTPALIDTERFNVFAQDEREVRVGRAAKLINWSGFELSFELERTVRILDRAEVSAALGERLGEEIVFVAYRTTNTIRNVGTVAWTRETGALSLWMLGMYPPSPGTVMAVPYRVGAEAELGPVVNADYFGRVPASRLKVADGVLFFKGDGEERGKIGLNPARSLGRLGSFASDSGVLTVVQGSPARDGAAYVNSMWALQDEPFAGDAINAYNDGPPTPGADPLGPFYELETSSPAAFLAPGETLTHEQMTVHLRGASAQLDAIAQRNLGASVATIAGAFGD